MIQDWLILRNMQTATLSSITINQLKPPGEIYIDIYMITSVVCYYYNMLACIQGSVLLPHSDANTLCFVDSVFSHINST